MVERDKPRMPRTEIDNGVLRWSDVANPTANVRDLVEASNKRQDNLREANNQLTKAKIKRLDAEIEHAKVIGKFREDCAKELASIREHHAKELRAAESSRLDAIRQVDVTAVRTEATRALEAIQTLAATSARDAETLRTAVVTSATTIAKSTSDTVLQITDRISSLEKSSYEGLGKQRIADPQLTELMSEMKSLRDSRAVGQGTDKTWGVVAVIVSIIISGTVAYVTISRAPAPAPAPMVGAAPSR